MKLIAEVDNLYNDGKRKTLLKTMKFYYYS